jgi:tetratricopeptide (TPR) repeat protein
LERDGQRIGQKIGTSRLGLGAVLLLLILPSLYVTQVEFLGYLGQKMAENRKFGQAADYYKRASMYMPFDGSFAMGEGNSLLRLGDINAAEKRFEDAADLMETNPHPHWQLGHLSGTADDWVSAVVHFQAALDRYPSSGRIRIDLSSAIIRAGDPKRGIEMLKTVPEYSRFEPETRELAESLLKKLGNGNLYRE